MQRCGGASGPNGATSGSAREAVEVSAQLTVVWSGWPETKGRRTYHGEKFGQIPCSTRVLFGKRRVGYVQGTQIDGCRSGEVTDSLSVLTGWSLVNELADKSRLAKLDRCPPRSLGDETAINSARQRGFGRNSVNARSRSRDSSLATRQSSCCRH